MDLYKYMCFILLTTVCYIDADFILTEKEYTWSEATQVCTLATPNLTFNESGITPEVANLPAEAWLGYTEKMTQFEYFGCAKDDDLSLTTADYITEGDPGKCWSACNYVEAIAVNGNKCYCLHNVNFTRIDLKKDKCDVKCPSQPKIVCGDGNDHVSLYKTTYTEPIMGNYPEGYICLWFDSNTTSFFWGNCTEYNLMICYNANDVWIYNAANGNSGWITMTTKCFRNGKTHGRPSNYNKTMDLVTIVTAEMWTGIIRNNVIYPITNTSNANVDKYGYVDSATRKLLVATDNAVRKRALCVEGTVITDTTTSTNEETTSSDKKTSSYISTGKTITSTGTTSTDKATIGTVETTTYTLKQTSSSGSDNSNVPTVTSSHATDSQSEGTTNSQGTTDENTTGKEEKLKKGSSEVGAIVGATVAIIIVIIVVIVLVVLWKRGIKFPLKKARKLEKEKKQATNMTYSFARPDNTIQGADETFFTNYADVDVSKMTLGGEVKQNGDTNRTSCSSDEPHTYFVLEKVDQGPYDKTKTTSQIHDQHTFNPYNKISIKESSNYDHIGAHVNDSKTLGLDNPYNTTTLTSSNKYNGFTNNAFNRNYESDDTYNHIDGQSCHTERNHSGNPYNTTAIGHSKNDGVTNIAFNINGERDDTYNHIGDQSAQNDQTITDNPYNTTKLSNSQINGVNNSTFDNNNDSEDTYNHINGQIPITRPTFTDNDYATLK